MDLYDSENASLNPQDTNTHNFNGDSDGHRSKPEDQLAILDQEVDKSAQNVDQNSIKKISSPESVVEVLPPLSPSDGSPEKVTLCQLMVTY